VTSGSTLGREEKCPPSGALPQVREDSKASNGGTIAHKYLEEVPKIGNLAAITHAPPDHRDFLASIDLDGLPLGPEYAQEVAVAYDLSTGKARLLDARNRQYVIGPNEIPATLDVVHRERVEIWDFKVEGWETYTAPPATNPQLHFGALCLAKIRGVTTARVGLIHIRPDGSHWIEHADLDLLDLDAFEARLARIVLRRDEAKMQIARGETPNVSRGDWCRYCPSKAYCPSMVSIVRAVSLAPQPTADELLSMLTPENAGKAYLRLKEIEAALAPVKSALHLFADEHDVDLGNGMVYGRVSTTREAVKDARSARKVLADLYGPEVAEAACDFETSKTAIRRAVTPLAEAKKKAGEKTSAAALERAALDAIRAAGAIEAKTTTTVREHRAGKEE
jgi:hypothetical protein